MNPFRVCVSFCAIACVLYVANGSDALLYEQMDSSDLAHSESSLHIMSHTQNPHQSKDRVERLSGSWDSTDHQRQEIGALGFFSSRGGFYPKAHPRAIAFPSGSLVVLASLVLRAPACDRSMPEQPVLLHCGYDRPRQPSGMWTEAARLHLTPANSRRELTKRSICIE